MRCINCGYDNPNPSIKNCVKCGHPLEAVPMNDYPKMGPALSSDSRETRVIDSNGNNFMGGSDQLKQTVMQAAPNEASMQLKKTVMQAVPSPQANQLKKTVIQGVLNELPLQDNLSSENDVCPKCQYPLSNGYCARCGYDRNSEEKPEEEIEEYIVNAHKSHGKNKCQHCDKEVPTIYQYCPYCGNAMDVGTVIISPDRISENIAETDKPNEVTPHFRLTMIADAGETISEEKAVREFEGDSVKLNRANTDPGNRTITSKEQAMVAYENGHWTIENRSLHNPTMVIADRKVELQSGDVIMLGDRRFRFELDI